MPSLYDYTRSMYLCDEPFYALLFACFRRADSNNLARLQEAFPEAYAEFVARYNAPGGVI